MIEDFLNIKLNPEEVFELYDVSDGELIKNAQELGWSQASKENLEQSRGEHGLRSDLYLYYALLKGKNDGLQDIDLFSFAGLMTSIIPGLGASFGTDTYAKESVIEDKALDLYNILSVRRGLKELTPLQIAQIIVDFCILEYVKQEKPKMIPKNYTLPETQIVAISEYARKNNYKNDSMALREIVEIAFKTMKKI